MEIAKKNRIAALVVLAFALAASTLSLGPVPVPVGNDPYVAVMGPGGCCA
jgi:hypothetical protein